MSDNDLAPFSPHKKPSGGRSWVPSRAQPSRAVLWGPPASARAAPIRRRVTCCAWQRRVSRRRATRGGRGQAAGRRPPRGLGGAAHGGAARARGRARGPRRRRPAAQRARLRPGAAGRRRRGVAAAAVRRDRARALLRAAAAEGEGEREAEAESDARALCDRKPPSGCSSCRRPATWRRACWRSRPAPATGRRSTGWRRFWAAPATGWGSSRRAWCWPRCTRGGRRARRGEARGQTCGGRDPPTTLCVHHRWALSCTRFLLPFEADSLITSRPLTPKTSALAAQVWRRKPAEGARRRHAAVCRRAPALPAASLVMLPHLSAAPVRRRRARAAGRRARAPEHGRRGGEREGAAAAAEGARPGAAQRVPLGGGAGCAARSGGGGFGGGGREGGSVMPLPPSRRAGRRPRQRTDHARAVSPPQAAAPAPRSPSRRRWRHCGWASAAPAPPPSQTF
jgi:hypothetical protein